MVPLRNQKTDNSVHNPCSITYCVAITQKKMMWIHANSRLFIYSYINPFIITKSLNDIVPCCHRDGFYIKLPALFFFLCSLNYLVHPNRLPSFSYLLSRHPIIALEILIQIIFLVFLFPLHPRKTQDKVGICIYV